MFERDMRDEKERKKEDKKERCKVSFNEIEIDGKYDF